MICPGCNRDIPADSAGQLARHKRSKSSKLLCVMSTERHGDPPKAKKRKRVVRKCPIHGVQLKGRPTSFGWRYQCPEEGCTVAAWSGSTSTPADQATRDARIAAHAAFDPLWRRMSSGDGSRRGRLYKSLAEFMGLSQENCHIGMFNAEQCEQVVQFCRTPLAPA